MKRWLGCLGAAALWPASTLAAPVDYGSIDGFVVPRASLEAAWPETPAKVDDEAFGFGGRVLSRVTDRLMVLAEYGHAGFDGAATNDYRLGAGLAGPSTSGFFLTYDHLSFGVDTAKGFAAHLRAAGQVWEPLGLYGDVAYGGWDANHFYFDGFEFTVGGTYDLPKPWGVFADYRMLMLDDRSNTNHDHLRFQQFRLGVRFRFDC